MIDLSQTIAPKSDQINADDLIGRTLTIHITGVAKTAQPDQPIAISFDGEIRVYKPGKSMRRVLVQAWGPDGNAYVGRSLTLYRDNGVKFGGFETGGIRISHMSHIDKPITMALTESKAKRKPFTVHPLVVVADDKLMNRLISALERAETAERVQEIMDSASAKDLVEKNPEHAGLTKAWTEALARTIVPTENQIDGQE